ncbi:CRISPR-associated ring nuclease [Roseiflexus sp.]|uniref:CRISPR-associated ring nuclease n=1 Tax=Roseiflexus sp. TaxID=2562120 RepID=UPI00398AC7DA
MTDYTESTVIATLGGQPQVITFALDALFDRGEQIRELYVLSLNRDRERTWQAWQRLQREFIDDYYGGRRCRLQRITVTRDGNELDDIRTDADVNAAFRAIRDLIVSLKNEGRRLHLCLSGGRRIMAMLAVSVAALFCDHYDQIWHVYTPEATLERVKGGAHMHLDPVNGFRLLRFPITPWGAYLPALRTFADPAAIQRRTRGLIAVDEPRCRQVWERLSARRRDVLRAFALGLRPEQVAERLCISLSTVNTHKTAILSECRIAWGLTRSEPLDYRFVYEHFAAFIEQLYPQDI